MRGFCSAMTPELRDLIQDYLCNELSWMLAGRSRLLFLNTSKNPEKKFA